MAHKNINQKLNWKKVSSDVSILNMASSNVSPIPEQSLVSISEVDEEMASVVSSVATATIKHRSRVKISSCMIRLSKSVKQEVALEKMAGYQLV